MCLTWPTCQLGIASALGLVDVEFSLDFRKENKFVLLIGEANFVYNNKRMTLSLAEKDCVTNEGHLAAVALAFYVMTCIAVKHIIL